jgi:hypothetical protein
VDAVFKPLASVNRRRLLDRLNTANGQDLQQLCSGLDMARQSISKHLAVLEDANLVWCPPPGTGARSCTTSTPCRSASSPTAGCASMSTTALTSSPT